MTSTEKSAVFGKASQDARRVGIGVGAGIIAGLLVVYDVTLMPGVPPTDSGELILAAWTGGVAHAPGFPLYVALGWLWTHLLPIGRVAWRLNFLSAFCAAAAAGLVYALARRTLHRTDETTRPWRSLLAAAAAALSFGLGRTVWGWATLSEVYALNLLLTAAILLLVFLSGGTGEQTSGGTEGRRGRGAEGPKSAADGGEAPSTRPAPRAPRLILAAFLFGLGLGNHLTSVALLAPAIAFWLTARHGWRFWISRTALASAFALAAGLAIYLYLPARAAADPLLNWGQPDTWQRFWWQVTAKQYRVSLLSSPVGPQVIFAAKLWWTQFTPIGLVLLGVGSWRMARSQPRLFWTLGLVIVFVTFYAWAYVIEDDGDAYYLPAFLAGSVWVAWGAATIADSLSRFFRRRAERPNRTRMTAGERGFTAGWPIVAVLVVTLIAALALNWRACDRHADTIPEDYARDTLAEIGPGGVLLTRDWQFYAPALYLQKVEGLRPDVTAIDTELLRRDWYFGLLHKSDPELMASVAAEEAAYRLLRDAWERGEIPDGDPRISQLQAAYVALLDAFMSRAAAAGRPVHIGPNRGAAALRDATLSGQPDMEPEAGAQWQWLPVGLSFRALPVGTQVPAASALAWQITAFDRAQPTAPERKIQATRADMATLHGLLQANLGNLAGAGTDWRLALAIDPAHVAATALLNRLKSQQ